MAKTKFEDMTPEEKVIFLQEQNAKLEESNANLTADLKAAKAHSDNTQKALEEKDEALVQAETVIAELQAENAKIVLEAEIQAPVVKFKGKSYKVAVPKFRLPGFNNNEAILASELKDDSEEVKELLALESNILEPLK